MLGFVACTITTLMLALSLVAAPQASAASEHFCQPCSLLPGYGFATVSAHSVYYVSKQSTNTACPSIAQGNSGPFWPPAGGTLHYDPCGPGGVGWAPPYTGYWHGAVYNPNIQTTVTVTDAHYSW